MKRLRRIVATDENYTTDIRFTLENVCELLSQVEELRDCEIKITPFIDRAVEFIIGETAYLMKSEDKGVSYM